MNIDRVQLIRLCQDAVVPQDKWQDRDSASAQRQLGECTALLQAGCEFKVFCGDGPTFKSHPDTLEVHIRFNGFNAFENGCEGDGDFMDKETFYLPTRERLNDAKGGDWY